MTFDELKDEVKNIFNGKSILVQEQESGYYNIILNGQYEVEYEKLKKLENLGAYNIDIVSDYDIYAKGLSIEIYFERVMT